MSLPIEEREVILGVDTHLDVHVAVLMDVVGRVIATHSVPTTAIGYEQLIEWAGSLGRLSRAGVEGTGTYGAGLARHDTHATAGVDGAARNADKPARPFVGYVRQGH